MPFSYIDRVFASWSGDKQSGLIEEDAPHWAIEPFIPIHNRILLQQLTTRPEATPEVTEAMHRIRSQIDVSLTERLSCDQRKLIEHYIDFDPDNDCRSPISDKPLPSAASQGEDCLPCETNEQNGNVTDRSSVEFVEWCESILELAAYKRMSEGEIRECVGHSSQWGVPLQVDFELFEHLAVFVRGDVVGTKIRRRLRKLYRPESVEVPVYQRTFVLFRLREDVDLHEDLISRCLHLRLFKNIPKQDLEMLLPGSRVRITKIDRVKIIVPSLGGLLMSLRKIVQFLLIFAALTLYSTAVLIGMILAAIGYVVKSVLSYFQTKNRYLLNMTRNLYFQKLDTNAGAMFRVVQQAHRQAANEMMLAYFGILVSEQPISVRRLRRYCERVLREIVGVEIAFRADTAIDRLHELGCIRCVDGLWTVSETAEIAERQ